MKKITLFTELKTKELFLELDENGREIYVYTLNNCSLSGHSAFYPDVLIESDDLDTYVLPYYETTMSLKRNSRYESEGMVFSRIKDHNTLTMNQIEPVFFFIYNTDNYFHFLYDSLPYLITYFHIKKTVTNLKLLMNYPTHMKKEFYKFVTEFLQLLEIGSSDIVIATECRYKTIYLSSSYTHNGLSNCLPRKEVYSLYDDMVKRAKTLATTQMPKKIYISRRTWIHNDLSNIGTNYTTRRKMMNEDELVETLTQHGFIEVFTENMSTVDKILLFYNAELIVGAIGGGIANALFSTPMTKLVAIVSPCFNDINKRFHFSLMRANVQYFNETQLYENINGFSKYMRVKHIKDGVIGEITEVMTDSVKVAVGNAHGWNNELVYDSAEFKYNEIIKLDEGLNSPYTVNLTALFNLLC
jgi:hypothetical protein